MDVESIGSGKFAQIILNQIAARPHYILIPTPGALKRTSNDGDWLRREIEYAIEKERNIVPLSFDGFSYKSERMNHDTGKFPGKLETLSNYNTLDVPDGYVPDAIEKLINRFLRKTVDVSIQTIPNKEAKEVDRKIDVANVARIDRISNEWLLPKSLTDSVPSFRSYSSVGLPLQAPKLTVVKQPDLSGDFGGISQPYINSGSQLVWTKPKYAKAFVLERAATKNFMPSNQVYKGEEAFYSISLADRILKYFFRVKATSSVGTLDSVWSNVVSSI